MLRRRPLLALCGQALELCPDWPQYPQRRFARRAEPLHVFGQLARVWSVEPHQVHRVWVIAVSPLRSYVYGMASIVPEGCCRRQCRRELSV